MGPYLCRYGRPGRPSAKTKQIQAFFLGFIWFGLDLLGRNSPVSCICGPWGRSSFGRLLICLPGRLGRQRPAVAPKPVRLARRGAEAQRAYPLRAAAAERLVELAAHLGILRPLAGDEHHTRE